MRLNSTPNIVIFFADDLGYGDLGCFGSKTNLTPNLDRLAKTGNRFTSFYSAQAVCSASRAGLLTGCYPNRIGISGALQHASKVGISDKERTLGQMLQAIGYRTACIGKWHLGHQDIFHPNNHGFDFSFGYPYSNDMWPRHPELPKKHPPLKLRRNFDIINPDVDAASMSTITADCTKEALDFIDKNRQQPFFLYMPYSMPHVPLVTSKAWNGRTKRGMYADVLGEIDDSVGQIMSRLRRYGIDQNTLVLFISDNGPWLSYGNHAGSAGELREGKGTTWEGGVRVPMIANWPGMIPAGMVTHQAAMTIDVLPTLQKLLKAPPSHLPIDGHDIWNAILNGDTSQDVDRTYWMYYAVNELQAVRKGRWKCVLPHRYQTLNGQHPTGNTPPAKYSYQMAELALYDLTQDIGETNNLATKRPFVLRQMLAEAETARQELGDALVGKVRGRGTRPPGMMP